jgi:hypothetical protein
MEPRCSWQCSQEPTFDPYPKPDKSSPCCLTIFFKVYFNNILLPMPSANGGGGGSRYKLPGSSGPEGGPGPKYVAYCLPLLGVRGQKILSLGPVPILSGSVYA